MGTDARNVNDRLDRIADRGCSQRTAKRGGDGYR